MKVMQMEERWKSMCSIPLMPSRGARYQPKKLSEEVFLQEFLQYNLAMSLIFLLFFELKWPPFIGQLQAISKLGSPCEREGGFINGGVSSSMAGQIRHLGEGLEAFNASLRNISVLSTINALNQFFFSTSRLSLRAVAPSRV